MTNDRPSPSGTLSREDTSATDRTLLGIYLNDHLAGATAGAERARHLARTLRGSASAGAVEAVEAVAKEIVEDRATLLALMKRLGVPVRRYKVCAGWTSEKAGRLKSNGRLVRRSPLSTLLELELLRIGVEGKAACWQALRRLTDVEEPLDPALLDGLLARARRQQDTLEELRVRQVGTAFRRA
jgi:hypothetical protein